MSIESFHSENTDEMSVKLSLLDLHILETGIRKYQYELEKRLVNADVHKDARGDVDIEIEEYDRVLKKLRTVEAV